MIAVRGRGSVAIVCSEGTGPKSNMSDDSDGFQKQRQKYLLPKLLGGFRIS